jgi:hypothetical protein
MSLHAVGVQTPCLTIQWCPTAAGFLTAVDQLGRRLLRSAFAAAARKRPPRVICWRVWYRFGAYAEGRVWVNDVLALPGARTYPSLDSQALAVGGNDAFGVHRATVLPPRTSAGWL